MTNKKLFELMIAILAGVGLAAILLGSPIVGWAISMVAGLLWLVLMLLFGAIYLFFVGLGFLFYGFSTLLS